MGLVTNGRRRCQEIELPAGGIAADGGVLESAEAERVGGLGLLGGGGAVRDAEQGGDETE
jgi:hypothetical protein